MEREAAGCGGGGWPGEREQRLADDGGTSGGVGRRLTRAARRAGLGACWRGRLARGGLAWPLVEVAG